MTEQFIYAAGLFLNKMYLMHVVQKRIMCCIHPLNIRSRIKNLGYNQNRLEILFYEGICLAKPRNYFSRHERSISIFCINSFSRRALILSVVFNFMLRSEKPQNLERRNF